MGVDVSPMWFVVLGVIIAIAVAYRHGRLAGFVAKVKADEAKLSPVVAAALAAPAARLEKLDASTATNGQGGPVTEWDVLTKRGRELLGTEVKKFGDEVKGWLPASTPQPTFEERLTRLRDVLDEALNKKPVVEPAPPADKPTA